MTNVKRIVFAFVLCVMATISVALAQDQPRTSVSNDRKLDALFPGISVAQGPQPTTNQPKHAAVANPFNGVWYGSIEKYPFRDSPLRTLTVSIVGGQPSCLWDQPGKKVGQLACRVEGNALVLTTGPGSNVSLRVKGDHLEGVFTPKNGQPLNLSMGRNPICLESASASSKVGPPVKCGAKGWRDGGTAYIIVNMLNPAKGTVDITGLSTDGRPWGGGHTNRLWTYKDGKLDYNYEQRYRIHLVVGERNLKGSFSDFNAPALSLPEVDYVCDGPLSRVTVR